MGTLAEKRVLVTGASRGIGRAIAEAMAAEGAVVALAAPSDLDPVRTAIRDQGGEARCYPTDIADENQIVRLIADITADLGGVDVLVNNAGVMFEKPLLETRAAEFDWVIGINLRGTFLVGRETIRCMSNNGGSGRVINIASDLGILGREQFSAYSASKAGVICLTKSWAKEFAPGILVNSISPGPIDTAMLQVEAMTPEWRRKEEDIPAGRVGQPEEIAAMAVFLAGPGATYITGQDFGVNGGSVMP